MTLNLGTVRPGSTIVVPFHTFDSNDPAASVAIAAFVLADIGIYKDLSMDERGSTTGVVLLDTDGIDIDAAVGIGGFSIDLSSNATAGFYASGSRYYVTVGPVTVDAAVVNFVAVTFDIGWPDALINTTINGAPTSDTQFILLDGPAEADVLIGCPIVIQAVAAARGVGIQIGYITDYIVTTKEVFIAADPGGGAVADKDHVAIMMPANVRAVGGTLQTAIDLGNEIGTAGVGLAEAGGDGDHLTAINLPNQTRDITGTITTVTNLTNHPSIPANWLTAAGINANAITSAKIASGAIDAVALAADAANEIADAVNARQTTEGYAADGVAPTNEQFSYMIWSYLHDHGFSGTTKTSRKLDNTTSMTHTLDDATNPTDITRAT